MNFSTDDEILKFVNNEKFYKNKNCFCIGKTLEEAAEITRLLIADVEREQNVGMVSN